jgi:hypothetical protein
MEEGEGDGALAEGRILVRTLGSTGVPCCSAGWLLTVDMWLQHEGHSGQQLGVFAC